MNGAVLRALKEQVRPVAITGALTLEQAAAAVRLNRDIARFHAALSQAEQILHLAGVLDERLRLELLTRAAQLVQGRAGIAGTVGEARL
jgi:hypothetical protein